MSWEGNDLQQLHAELKSFMGRYGRKVSELEKRLDTWEVESQRPGVPVGGTKTADLAHRIWTSDEFERLRKTGRGQVFMKFEDVSLANLETRAVISSSAVGSGTSGVLMPQRVPGIVPAARRRLFVRDLLTVFPAQSNAVDFVRVDSDIQKASPQVEASAKYENALTFTTETAPVRTIATWIPATRQVLEDFSSLEAFIRGSLTYAVMLEEENQILSGSGTGENLNGLITQATPFNTGLLSASDGWEKVDILARAVQQVHGANEVEPDFVVLHPNDWWDIRLTKSNDGEYLIAPPTREGPDILFGLRVITTTALTPGVFLVGSSSPASVAIFERSGLTVEVSTEHSDYFTRNLVAIRAEERLALVVFRPGAYVTGSLTTSPA
jgi:HK97 family phage major capsid protein